MWTNEKRIHVVHHRVELPLLTPCGWLHVTHAHWASQIRQKWALSAGRKKLLEIKTPVRLTFRTCPHEGLWSPNLFCDFIWKEMFTKQAQNIITESETFASSFANVWERLRPPVPINQVSCRACASTPAVQICPISHGPRGVWARKHTHIHTHRPPESSVKWGSATAWGLSDNKTHFTAAVLYKTGLRRARAKTLQLPRPFNLCLLHPKQTHTIINPHPGKRQRSNPSTLWTDQNVFPELTLSGSRLSSVRCVHDSQIIN